MYGCALSADRELYLVCSSNFFAKGADRLALSHIYYGLQKIRARLAFFPAPDELYAKAALTYMKMTMSNFHKLFSRTGHTGLYEWQHEDQGENYGAQLQQVGLRPERRWSQDDLDP